MGNDQGQVDEIIACGKEAGENFWQLPLSAEYSKQIKRCTDIKNIGPRMKAGTIMGAAFIQSSLIRQNGHTSISLAPHGLIHPSRTSQKARRQ